MSNVIITPALLCGTVTPPPSKSAAHRAILCAALAGGKTRIAPFETSNDMDATIGAVTALGASVTKEEGSLLVDGTSTFRTVASEIDCLESGSTLRFLIPVAAAAGADMTFTGHGLLPQRPIGPYLDCLPKAGVRCETSGGLPLRISGSLKPGVFTLPGDVSSQFVTGLLLALPLLGGDSEIRLSSPLQSESYVDLTIDMMRRFGVGISRGGQSFFVKGNQKYTPCSALQIEGDWSQAAFWLAAGAIGAKVDCLGLDPSSGQGDRAVIDILRRFGANAESSDNAFARGGSLHGCTVDASQIPDLVPVLAVVAALATGRTVIGNAARLRLKESDRLHSVALGLRALGATISEQEDALVIDGAPTLQGGTVDGANDHRIVMAFAIAAMRCENPVTITSCESIKKSYPTFFYHYNSLGGCAHVVSMG